MIHALVDLVRNIKPATEDSHQKDNLITDHEESHLRVALFFSENFIKLFLFE